jgi:hypothetical protein
MSTFWERATGFGDGANELLDLDVLQAVLILRFPDLITVSRAKNMLGLTPAQGEEFDQILDRLPGTEAEVAAYGSKLRAGFVAARLGIPELDTIDNVMIAMGFDPPAPTLP